MPSPKVLGAVVLVAMAAGVVPGVPGIIGGSSDEAEAIEAPDVLPVTSEEAIVPDDGFIRLIVTPTGGPNEIDLEITPAEQDASPGPSATEPPVDTTEDAEDGVGVADATAEDATSDVFDAEDTDPVDAASIDPAVLEQLTAGAVLVIDDDGRPWAEYPDGTRVPLFRASAPPPAALLVPTPAAEPTPTAAPDASAEADISDELDDDIGVPDDSVGHPTMDIIAEADGVEEVIAIGDGTFAVRVTDPSVLDGYPVDVAEDAPMGISTDPYEVYQWGLENDGTSLSTVVDPAPLQVADSDIDAPASFAAATGAGVVVAVVDSGVDFSHPDLARAEWTNAADECGNGVDDDGNGYVDDCRGWDFGYNDNTPFNDGAHAHGTHVAGIIAAGHNNVGVAGIAPGVDIMNLNVGTITASGQPGITTSAVARAVRYAVDNGADVINLSLGTPAGSPREASQVVESAIAYAADHGVVVVAAAGNEGTNLDAAPSWPASYEFPNMITVGASDPGDGPASFSNYGGAVDVFAPGHLILSTVPATDGSYVFMSGTSQAAPAVAAVAALVLDRTPTLSPEEIHDQLTASSDRNDALSGHVANGVRLNAANATGQGRPEYNIADVTVSVRGLTGADEAAVIDATIDIGVPAGYFDEPYRWETSLFTTTDDGVFAVVGHEIAVGGFADATDERGAVALGIDESGAAAWSTRLPGGRYHLVLEAVTLDDPNVRLGDPLVSSFSVTGVELGDDDAADPAEDEQAPSTADDDGDDVVDDQASEPADEDGANEGQDSTSDDDNGATNGTDGEGQADASDDASSAGSDNGDADSSDTTGASDDSSNGEDTGADSGTSDTGDGGSDDTEEQAADDAAPTDDDTDTDDGNAAEDGNAAGVVGDIPPAPRPVTGNGWAIDGVTPHYGPVNDLTVIQLTGKFPGRIYVWFGEIPGTVLHQTKEEMVVLVPERSTPGPVDISLRRSGKGNVLVMENGFTYMEVAGAVGTDSDTTDPGSADGPAVDDGRSGGETNRPGPGPGDAPDDAGSPSEPGNGDAPVDDDADGSAGSEGTEDEPADNEGERAADEPVSQRQNRASLASPIDLGNGLMGAKVVGGDPTPGAPSCSTDPCRMS